MGAQAQAQQQPLLPQRYQQLMCPPVCLLPLLSLLTQQEEKAIAEGVMVRDAWDGSIQDIELEVTGFQRQEFTEEQERAAVESAVSACARRRGGEGEGWGLCWGWLGKHNWAARCTRRCMLLAVLGEGMHASLSASQCCRALVAEQRWCFRCTLQVLHTLQMSRQRHHNVTAGAAVCCCRLTVH